MDRVLFERALDAGLLETAVVRGFETRWYQCRRNGKTRTWKRDPSRFRIPIRFRLRDTMTVTESDLPVLGLWFRVAPFVK